MEHHCDLVEWIGRLLFDDKTSDVTLIVVGERLPAHRLILAASCEYFRALLHGEMKESLQSEVVLADVPLRGFKLLMSYIYTGQLRLEELDDDTVLEVLEIVHMYGYGKLEIILIQELQERISMENVCKIYNSAHLLKLEGLAEACCRCMLAAPGATLETKAFLDLSEPALREILTKDTFCATEIDIFGAVLKWRNERPPEQDIANVLKLIRLPLIDTKDLVTTVKDSGLIATDRIVDVIRERECNVAGFNFRGALRSDENLATTENGALRLTEKSSGYHVSAKTCPRYDSEEMPAYDSDSSFPYAAGFTVALGEAFFINHISFRFREKAFECLYYVEVSVNLVDWVRIIDHSQYVCHSSQNLYFEPRVVRYIRLNVTWTSTGRGHVKLTEFSVTHVTKPFRLSCGLYAPESGSFAIESLGALVYRKESDHDVWTELNGDRDGYEGLWYSHRIRQGSIILQFPQPFALDSMRMKLCEAQAYSYYVETSVDNEKWTRVADHTTDLRCLWQDIFFETRPVLYINIVGTASTADKLFSCKSFQCPAPVRLLGECRTQKNESVSGSPIDA